MSDISIIGGGHASGKLVNNLHKLEFKGNINIFSEEKHLPYERPPLSKDYLYGSKKFEDFKIDINLEKVNYYFSTKINKIDFNKKLIYDQNNNNYSYDKLVFANGSSPKRIFEENIEGVNYLRTLDDSVKIKSSIEISRDIVLLGAGYISLEIASTIKKNYPNKEVTIIDNSEKILLRNSNDDLREFIFKYQKKNNVKFLFNTSLQNLIRNEDGSIKSLILDDNKILPCDLLVVGIGVYPNTDILKGTMLEEKNGIKVNEYCETSVKDVFALGDVALSKNNFLNKHIREESWNNAEKQSDILAKNLTGTKTSYDEIPWFWTDQFDQNFQILGEINYFDNKILRNYSENMNTIIYFKNKKIIGAVAVNNGRDISIIRKIIKKNIVPNMEKIQNIDINLKELL